MEPTSLQMQATEALDRALASSKLMSPDAPSLADAAATKVPGYTQALTMAPQDVQFNREAKEAAVAAAGGDAHAAYTGAVPTMRPVPEATTAAAAGADARLADPATFEGYVPVDPAERLFPEHPGDPVTPAQLEARKRVHALYAAMNASSRTEKELWEAALDRASPLAADVRVRERRDGLVTGLTHIATHSILRTEGDAAARLAFVDHIRAVMNDALDAGVWPCLLQSPTPTSGGTAAFIVVPHSDTQKTPASRTLQRDRARALRAIGAVHTLLINELGAPFMVLVARDEAHRYEAQLRTLGFLRTRGAFNASATDPEVFAVGHNAAVEPNPVINAAPAFMRAWACLYRAVNARGETVPQNILFAGAADPSTVADADKSVALEFLLARPPAPAGCVASCTIELPSATVRADEGVTDALRRLVVDTFPGGRHKSAAQVEALALLKADAALDETLPVVDEQTDEKADADSSATETTAAVDEEEEKKKAKRKNRAARARARLDRRVRREELQRRAARPFEPEFTFVHVTVARDSPVPSMRSVNLVYELAISDADRSRLFAAARDSPDVVVYRVPMVAPYVTPSTFALDATDRRRRSPWRVRDDVQHVEAPPKQATLSGITAHTISMVVSEIGRALNALDARHAAMLLEQQQQQQQADGDKKAAGAVNDDDDGSGAAAVVAGPPLCHWMDVRRLAMPDGAAAPAYEVNFWFSATRPVGPDGSGLVCLPDSVIVGKTRVPNLNRALVFWNTLRDESKGQWKVGPGATTLHYHRNYDDPRAADVAHLPLPEIIKIMCPNADAEGTVVRELKNAPAPVAPESDHKGADDAGAHQQ